MSDQGRDEKLSQHRVRQEPNPMAEKVALLNRLIDRFNFVVPLGNLQRARYRE